MLPFKRTSRKYRLIYSDRKHIRGCSGAKVGEEVDCKSARENFRTGLKCSLSSLVVVSYVYTSVKTHQIIHYKRGQIIIWKLYLDEVDEKMSCFMSH